MGYPTGQGGGGGQSPVPIDWTQGPKPRYVSAKAITASQQLFTGLGTIIEASFAETTGSARALAYLHDGTDATGGICGVLGASSGGGGEISPGWPGIYFQSGLYLEVVSGTISVAAIIVAAVDQLPN